MDALSEEEPGPPAPDPLTWNPSDAMQAPGADPEKKEGGG